MGSNASKMGRSGSRVLQTKRAPSVNKAVNQIPSTRSPRSQNGPETGAGPSEDQVADRLRRIEPVKEIKDLRNYRPASEDQFTITLEARQRLDDAYTLAKEQGDSGAPRRHIPATTISAVVKSIEEGEPTDRILKMYNLDPSVLPLLRMVSTPQMPKQSLPNELLHDNANNAQRQPVRRKRRTN